MKRLATISVGNTLAHDDPAYLCAINLLTASAAITECSLYDAGSKSLGAEIATNGGFADATDWTANSGWSISAGVASHTIGTGTLTEAGCAPVAGSIYKVTFTVGKSGSLTGTVAMSLGGVTGATRSTKATFTEYIKASSTAAIAFTPSNDFDGFIENVSVKKIADANSLIGTFALATNAESKFIEFMDSIPCSYGIFGILAGTGGTAQIFG